MGGHPLRVDNGVNSRGPWTIGDWAYKGTGRWVTGAEGNQTARLRTEPARRPFCSWHARCDGSHGAERRLTRSLREEDPRVRPPG